MRYDIVAFGALLKIFARRITMAAETAACGCPEVRDEDWDLVEKEWEQTAYYSKRLWMFFHNAIGSARRIAAARAELSAKGLKEKEPAQVLIKDGLFAGAVLVAVADAAGSDAQLVTLGGTKTITKVARGSKKEIKAAVSGLLSYVRSKLGAHPRTVYFWRVDCETCRVPGEEHTIILAEL
jgi:hypothetical protein